MAFFSSGARAVRAVRGFGSVALAVAAWGAAVACTASARAQRPVFTVGGSNPSFATLPAAVAAVPPGSVLEVRPGAHVGFTTSKPLRIELDFDAANGVVQAPPGAAYTIVVTGLPAGDEFVLAGRGALLLPGSLGVVRVANAAAPVVIEGVSAAGAGAIGLDVHNATAVHARRSVLGGTPGLQAQLANIVVSECVVLASLGVGAIAYLAHFEAARTYFSGVNQAALRLIQCTGRLASDGSTTIAAVALPGVPVAPLEAIDSVLQLDDDRIGLVPNGSTPPFARTGGSWRDQEVPTLITTPAPPGAIASVRMTSSAPHPGAILLGLLRGAPVAFDGANIWADPQLLLVSALGVCDANGLTATTAIPATPVVLGAVFCQQGIVWQPGGAVLSAPGLWIAL